MRTIFLLTCFLVSVVSGQSSQSNLLDENVKGSLFKDSQSSPMPSFPGICSQLVKRIGASGGWTDFLSKHHPVADVGRSAQQLIESRGFKAETHYITTKDNYILGVIRIVNPKLMLRSKNPGRPVILHHGIMLSANSWVNNAPGGGIDEPLSSDDDPGNNLGFVLAKRGYDVWLGNSRGTVYSRNHTTLDPTSYQFWDFTHDEMIEYDMPALVDYILKVTGHPTLAYVGHSQGTAIMFGLLATKPKYNNLVKPYIALAPVVLVGNGSRADAWAALGPMFAFNAIKGGMAVNDQMARAFQQALCRGPITSLCVSMLEPLIGKENHDNTDIQRWPVYVFSESLGESAKNLNHWTQQPIKRAFTKYDYGTTGNYAHYGQQDPPVYDLGRVTNRNIYIRYAKSDAFVGPRDVDNLVNHLTGTKVVSKLVVADDTFSHIDFMDAKNVGVMVNSYIIKTLKKYD